MSRPSAASSGGSKNATWKRDETLDLPMVGVYELSDGKLVGTQMFYSDTAAALRFLESAGRARP